MGLIKWYLSISISRSTSTLRKLPTSSNSNTFSSLVNLSWAPIPVTPPARLTHWGRVTHICVSKLVIIGSDNGLAPGRRQAIIWTYAGILLIGPLGTNFSEILIEIHTFSFKKMRFKLSSGKWRPFCLGLNVLTHCSLVTLYGSTYID